LVFTLPERFDWNEWYVLASLVFTTILFFALPKRMPSVMAAFACVFNSLLGTTTDMLIAVEYPFNYYDTMDTGTYDLFDFFIYNINYSLYGYLSWYAYAYCMQKGWRLAIFILAWSAVTVFFEWIAVEIHVFTYRRWNIGLSMLTYLFVFYLNVLLYKFVRKEVHKHKPIQK
jgi:hypothetical protein